MQRVGFVGIPGIDSTVEQILHRGACEVALWCPEELDGDIEFDGPVVDLEQLSDIPLIVLSTSIGNCRQLARRIGDVISGQHVLMHTIRGVEEGTLNTASRIFHDETPTRRIGFVTGPMRLDDVREGLPGAALCASRFPEVHELVEEAMMTRRFRVYHSPDLFGAELAATYGRLVALISGVARGLGLGLSLEATIFSRGLAEMGRFVAAMEGQEPTAFGLAGAGNLYVDINDESDVDFQMGRFLAETTGDRAQKLVDNFEVAAREILAIADSFAQAGRRAGTDLHLLDAISAVLVAGRPLDDALEDLMGLPALPE